MRKLITYLFYLVITYIAVLGGLWTLLESIAYFKDDSLRNYLGLNWAYFIYGVPGFITGCVSIIRLYEDNKSEVNKNSNIKLSQFAIDSKESPYIAHYFDSKKDIFPGKIPKKDRVRIPNARVSAFGRDFVSIEDADAYQEQLEKKTNHYYFRWLKNIGLKPKDVPIVFEKVKKDSSKLLRSHCPLFVFTITNHSTQQVVVSRIECSVEKVIVIRGGDNTGTLEPHALYSLAIDTQPGKYGCDLLPPLKIAANDSISFKVRVLPKSKDTIKSIVLVSFFTINTTLSEIFTSKFMFKF